MMVASLMAAFVRVDLFMDNGSFPDGSLRDGSVRDGWVRGGWGRFLSG